MKLSVIIPTYRRAAALRNCLEGLRQQIRRADEVLIVVLEDDEDSLRMLESWTGLTGLPELRVLRTTRAGQVNQLNCGIDASTGDILAITDDDTVPRPQWLHCIEENFRGHPDVGGVGGRDFIHDAGVESFDSNRPVGTVLWFGRMTGDHHLGAMRRERVDILKGANMSYRRTAIGDARFDNDLRGQGAQVCNDMAFSLEIGKRGWRLLFDPDAAVDHYPAERVGFEHRVKLSLQTIEDNSFNYFLSIVRHMRPGPRRVMALLWARLVGVKRSPGLLRGLYSRIRSDREGIELRAAAARAWRMAVLTGREASP